MTIETLTKEDRELLVEGCSLRGDTALRIIDAQAVRIAELEGWLNDWEQSGSKCEVCQKMGVNHGSRHRTCGEFVLQIQSALDAANARAEAAEGTMARNLAERDELNAQLDAAQKDADFYKDSLAAAVRNGETLSTSLAELKSRIALACAVADSCSGNYMRLILTGEIDLADHESRKL